MFNWHPSLKALLIAPYLVLVLATAAIIGGLSYRAGGHAVDDLSGQLLKETVHRIAQSVENHVSGSAAVLEAAFPRGIAAPASFEGNLGDLRTRFWLATSVHRDPNNYAYYGDRNGRFFGLWRYSDSEAELRLRMVDSGPRAVYRFTGIQGELGQPVVETRIFDPRERPWFRAAQVSPTPTWTSIYIDFKTSELVATRTRRVNTTSGEFEGVVATDLSLQRVSEFLKRLSLSKNGLAMVVENDGQLIGVSRGPHLRPVNGKNERLNAAASDDPMVVATYAAVSERVGRSASSDPSTAVFEGPDGGLVQVGYARLRDEAGLDWLIMVAVPRADFLTQVVTGFRTAAGLGVLAAIGVAVIGLAVLGTVTRELRGLAGAVRRVAEGDLSNPLTSERKDELGDLARSFGDMQRRLLTDTLTGLSNREAVLRRIEERIVQQRRRGDSRPFAVVFADLNGFKGVNDRFGHDVGDAVLRELGERLRANARSGDLVARFAGDEFVILLESVDNRRDAEAARAHIEQALLQPLHALNGLDVPELMGGACGLALFPDEGKDVQTLLKSADEDMYQRKRRI
jgi:diguanylate cyclase (GGDEF)-like protein